MATENLSEHDLRRIDALDAPLDKVREDKNSFSDLIAFSARDE